MFQSLRVAVQCSANNENEARHFQKYHNPHDDACTMAMHVGCALWGRTDSGDYYRQRRSWFFPGFSGDDVTKEEEEPVVEVYCPHHALNLFYQDDLKKSSDMESRLPGPFAPIQGTAQQRLARDNNKKKTGGGANSVSGVRRDSLSEFGSHAGSISEARAPKRTGKSIIPGASVQAGASASPLRRKSSSTSDHAALARKRPPDARMGSASASVNRSPMGTSSVQPSITLHGETRRKRHQALKKAGEAVQVQTQKHGRLVSTSAIAAVPQVANQESISTEAARLNQVQHILNSLLQRQQECEAKGKAFGTPERATLRVQLLKQFRNQKSVADVDFSDIWKRANEALKDGIQDVTIGQKEQEEEKEEQANSEIVNAFAKDILDELDAKQQTEENRSQEIVSQILKERKVHWKKQTGLSKADFKIIFAQVAEKLMAERTWITITSKPALNEASESQKLDAHEMLEVQLPLAALANLGNRAVLEDSTIANRFGEPEEDEPVFGNEGEMTDSNEIPDHSADRASLVDEQLRRNGSGDVEHASLVKETNEEPGNFSDVEEASSDKDIDEDPGSDDDTKEDHSPSIESSRGRTEPAASNAFHVSSRWSHLHYGPSYRKEGFQFDAWDTYEEIDAISSTSDEGD